MAFSPQDNRTPTTLSEINVTPFVDVMLVLLIVFMISAPLMQQGVQVDLPKADAGTLTEVPDEILLVINQSKRVMMNGKLLQPGTLLGQLRKIAKRKPDIQVFVRADRRIPYGFIAQVIAEVKQAKIHRVGLVTEPGKTEARI